MKKRFTITIKGKTYCPKLTMRALRLFKEAAGYDLLTSSESFDSYDVITLLWACAVCGSLGSGEPMKLSAAEFENEIHPTQIREISEWFRGQMAELSDPEAAGNGSEEADDGSTEAGAKKKKG